MWSLNDNRQVVVADRHGRFNEGPFPADVAVRSPGVEMFFREAVRSP